LAKFVNSSFVPSPLNQSIPSRFTPISSTPIGTLIDELFIESWQNSSNYSSYYSICTPSNCKYTYVESNDFVHILTTILGLYGGLTQELPIVIWGSLQMYWKILTGGYNDSYLKGAELYNPSTNTWTTVGNMNIARKGHTAYRHDQRYGISV
ncbi:unnamed protein product, partial [Adineta ricciae]